MGRSDQVYEAIKNGATNYKLLIAAIPGMTEHQIKAGVSYLKCADYISKTGMAHKSVFTINPEKPYVAYQRKPYDEDNVPEVNNIPSLQTQEVSLQTASSVVIQNTTPPDFNQLFQDMVKLLSDQIVIKAKERAYHILNTPELANELGQKIMNQFSVPVVVFNGNETSAVMFNKPPTAGLPVGVPYQQESSSQPETNIPKIDMSVIQAPKEPEVSVVRKRLPRVCVTGLKPIEAGRISQEFGETFDLVFWNDRNGDGVDQLRAHANNCQALFWHIKHGSHSNEAIARNGSATFFRVNGDLSQMRNKLREYYTHLKDGKSVAA